MIPELQSERNSTQINAININPIMYLKSQNINIYILDKNSPTASKA